MIVEHKTEKGTVLEIWKDIQGYEGLYQVSNFFRVKSVQRKVFNKRGNGYMMTVKYKILKKEISQGLDCVSLSKNGRHKICYVHNIFYQTFRIDLYDGML